MGTAMYVSPEQATGAQVTEASDIYSLGVVAYECLAGRPPFTASEPLAIAFAHKHEPVPDLPPDVPEPVSDLVYHMLAKTPQERPGSVRLVADRADMLRDALALGESAEPGYPGATRADLPAAATDPLSSPRDPGTGPFPGPWGIRIPGRASRRRRLIVAGSTAALCAAAAAAGLYLTGHISGRNSGNVDLNSAQHLSSSAAPPAQHASQPASSTLTPTPSQTARASVPVPNPSGNPKPVKSVKPTKSPGSSPPTSPSSSASSSSSPTDTGSPSVTPSSSSPSTSQ
jgi:serine/threonine-protein kinase